jgi:hypothetical protein
VNSLEGVNMIEIVKNLFIDVQCLALEYGFHCSQFLENAWVVVEVAQTILLVVGVRCG